MFFNSIEKAVKGKTCNTDKHMELELYRKPIISFQWFKVSECVSKLWICIRKCWKTQLQWQLVHVCHPLFRSTSFPFNPSLFLAFSKFLRSPVLLVQKKVRQLVNTMFITNNRASFHLRWKETLVKHQKVSKYYENDCRFQEIAVIYFTSWAFFVLLSCLK